jgi:hypothetical protein
MRRMTIEGNTKTSFQDSVFTKFNGCGTLDPKFLLHYQRPTLISTLSYHDYGGTDGSQRVGCFVFREGENVGGQDAQESLA